MASRERLSWREKVQIVSESSARNSFMDFKRILSPGTSTVQDAGLENFFNPFLDHYIMVITGYSNDILGFLNLVTI